MKWKMPREDASETVTWQLTSAYIAENRDLLESYSKEEQASFASNLFFAIYHNSIRMGYLRVEDPILRRKRIEALMRYPRNQ